VWDQAEDLPLLLADGTTNYVYGPGGVPLEQVSGSTVYYFHHDQLGSTRVLTNSAGATVATYTYDPYGKLTASTGSVTNPFGYAGQYTDAETGFQYLRARYYDPATGGFVSRDPIARMTGAPYAYADSSPLNGTDPSGLDTCYRHGVRDRWHCHQDPAEQVVNCFSYLDPGVCTVATLPLGGGISLVASLLDLVTRDRHGHRRSDQDAIHSIDVGHDPTCIKAWHDPSPCTPPPAPIPCSQALPGYRPGADGTPLYGPFTDLFNRNKYGHH
jgi:RHS repeat-associated protein